MLYYKQRLIFGLITGNYNVRVLEFLYFLIMVRLNRPTTVNVVPQILFHLKLLIFIPRQVRVPVTLLTFI